MNPSDCPATPVDPGSNARLQAPRLEARALYDESFRSLVQGIEDYAIFLLDPTGHVISWNSGAARIKGYAAEEIIGQHFARFYTEEAIARDWPNHELREAARQGRFEDEGWRVRKDGTMFWANVVITALRGPEGQLTGFAKVTRDLTNQRRQLEALRQSEERFRLLVESVKDYAIFMLDLNGYVVSWNAGAMNLKGYAREEIIGRHFSVFYTAEEIATGKPERELSDAKKFGSIADEGWRRRKDGSMFWAHVTITAVYDEKNELRGFAKVTRDLTERRHREELERSGERMRRFLAILAHELRNPLAPVRNAISVMRLESGLTTSLARSRDLIDRQITHLTRLVDDLLDVGRITSGKVELQLADIDLAEVIARSVEAARPFTEARGQHVEVELPAQPLPVRGDMTRLVQVLQNLLHNAAKFSEDDSTITIRASSDEGWALLQVIDRGCGIATDLLEPVFDLFVQEQQWPKPGEGGLGIGLTLCRTLVEQHGGTISAHSGGRGHGCTLAIRLALLAKAPVGAPGGAADESRQRSAAPLHILVVDDNRDSADSLAMLLGLMGHDVRIAYDGTQALELAHRFTPHIALIDIAMPEMDGYQVLAALTTIPAFADTLFAAMTGFGLESDIARTRDAGFHAHLVKPVEMEKFEALLVQAELLRR